uniref:Glycine--tRNA ligase n=1 Tax=Panagrellus redivivus TaxID=6233 RepID=A0A7E4V802_PANRE
MLLGLFCTSSRSLHSAFVRSFATNVKPAKFSKRVRHRASDFVKAMATSEIEAKLEPLRLDVKTAGDKVRELKATGAPKNDLDRAVFELKALKKKLEDTELALTPKDAFFERAKMEDLLKRRFFYDQSFAIYGGVTGLYDFGPMGCALKANMIDVWRKHFILEEGMLEVECSALTPENVLKASGHVERFIDWMVKDVKTGDCFRADHLIKNHAEALLKDKTTTPALKAELEDILIKLDGYDNNDMDAVIKKYGFKSPITKNDVSEPVSFNLMFPSQIGPTGDAKAFLRPETAQGIFINFKRLYEFNQSKLPFAAAQIGSGFRNEISPRQGLIRVREFTMCEIEHFVDPTDKDHPKFGKIANLELLLYSACDQMDGKPAKRVKVADAVASKIIDNETLAYYMARTNLFLVSVGVDPARLRFRQHMGNEMAHYAKDCWDAEIMTSYGWIECVGHADRSCYDLQQHAKATNVKLVATKPLAQPKKVTQVVPVPNMAVIGKAFKADGKLIKTLLEKLEPSEVTALAEGLKAGGYELSAANGKSFKLTPDMVSVKEEQKTLHVEELVPSVIEPSFGIGRIMYAVLEHSFRQREGDEQRTYFELKPLVAPYKASVLPISVNEKLEPIVTAVRDELSALHLSYRVDESGISIGKRYARTDELGIPFAITIDFESVNAPHTVTLRDLASMQQVRLQVSEVAPTVLALSRGVSTWADVAAKFPLFTASSD